MGKKWKVSDFEFKQIIGEGKFGKVYKAIDRKSRTPLAIKKISKFFVEKTNNLHNLRREVEIHCRLHHPNIIRLYGYFHDKKSVYLVLDLVQKGTLYEYVKAKKTLRLNVAKKVNFNFYLILTKIKYFIKILIEIIYKQYYYYL